MDEDERQEYECLLLEGHSHDDAARMARSANDVINRGRLSGPRSADRNGHGQRPYISDMLRTESYEAHQPYTMDSRDDDEREEDWREQDHCHMLLDSLTPEQRKLLDTLYGISTGEPMTWKDCASALGMTYNAFEAARAKAVRALKLLTGEITETDIERKKRERNERNRRRYAEQKAAYEAGRRDKYPGR